MSELGGRLRSSLVRAALRTHSAVEEASGPMGLSPNRPCAPVVPVTLANVVAMDLVGVLVEVPANTPMVLLRERGGRQRLLPIFIGNVEATAIHYALEEIQPPRPLTLMTFSQTPSTICRSPSSGWSSPRCVSTPITPSCIFTREGHEHVVSSRPSDAIALAVRSGASIHVDDDLLDEVGQEPAVEPEDEAEEIIDEFRDFIENVSPEDFVNLAKGSFRWRFPRRTARTMFTVPWRGTALGRFAVSGRPPGLHGASL